VRWRFTQYMTSDPNPYIPNSSRKIIEEMLKELGVESIEELYRDIPKSIPRHQAKDIPLSHSELEVRRILKSITSKNKTVHEMPTFLGAGVWPHYVPAVVDMVVGRSEFLTSYTPYQAEIAQGMLQALFEYQSVIAELLDLDVVNSSLYDWPTAVGEAALLAKRATQRNTILVPHIIHPDRLSVLKTYVEAVGVRVEEVSQDKKAGKLLLQSLRSKLSDDVAAVYIENPSYLGFIEEQVDDISKAAHERGSLLIAGVDPTSLGVIRPPGSYEADIAVGEGQPLGNHMSFGGPLLGILGCRDDPKLIRQVPGRLVGMTTTLEGSETGFVLTLQTREQHIRREKATSNITSNEALCAIAALVYCSLLGAKGFKQLGELILANTHYAIRRLSRVKGLRVPVIEGAHFKEFTVNTDESGKSIHTYNRGLLQRGIQGGHPVDKEFPEFGNTALLCVTEIHSQDEINKLVSATDDIMRGAEKSEKEAEKN
jgi:glycine dehydrogenase subunit 1